MTSATMAPPTLDRAELERVIEASLGNERRFEEGGLALEMIQRTKSYEPEYRSFKAYYTAHNWKKTRVYEYIASAAVKVALRNCGQFSEAMLPQTESVCRPLFPKQHLNVGEQMECWLRVVETGEPVTAALVKRIVSEYLVERDGIAERCSPPPREAAAPPALPSLADLLAAQSHAQLAGVLARELTRRESSIAGDLAGAKLLLVILRAGDSRYTKLIRQAASVGATVVDVVTDDVVEAQLVQLPAPIPSAIADTADVATAGWEFERTTISICIYGRGPKWGEDVYKVGQGQQADLLISRLGWEVVHRPRGIGSSYIYLRAPAPPDIHKRSLRLDIDVPQRDALFAFAQRCHAAGQSWRGDAWGMRAEYAPARRELRRWRIQTEEGGRIVERQEQEEVDVPAQFTIGGEAWRAHVYWRNGPALPPYYSFGEETIANPDPVQDSAEDAAC